MGFILHFQLPNG